jgi:uncharacterized Zn finger protein
MSWYSRRNRYENDYGYGGFAPYVPVAQRLAQGVKHAKALAKKQGREPEPVKITTKGMASTYWGKAWCTNLEAYSDYANRLPRGRTYARNGSVVDLQIKKGKIEAIVSGSNVYTISITIETLTKPLWNRLKAECSQSISSLIDLLQGRFDEGVMKRLAHPTEGLFPRPKEIKMRCSCPDSAGLCKHLAAVLYGVGNRLDNSPELLFTLRNVDHMELVSQAVAEGNLDQTLDAGKDNALVGSDLGEIFGIELDQQESAPIKVSGTKKPAAKKSRATAAAKTRPAKSKATAVMSSAKGKGKRTLPQASRLPRKPR